MAIAPNDPRHRDLSASDVLSPLTWPRRGARPAVGLDVICTKIAVDFQGMTEATAADCILAEPRTAARGHPAPTRPFTSSWTPTCTTFADVQVARGMLATGNPEQLRGQSLETLPWLRSRVAPLRVSEFRDTAKPRPDQGDDAAAVRRTRHRLGADDRLLSSRRVPPASWESRARMPCETWDVQLHLLMKLVGSSLATGLERIEIQAPAARPGGAQRARALQRE